MTSTLDHWRKRLLFWTRAAWRKAQGLVWPAQYDRPIAESLRQFQQAHPLPPEGVTRPLDGGLALLVPCYNHAAYLPETLHSIASQTYRPFEVIFIDDCSPDRTAEILQHFCSHPPAGIKTTVLRTPHNAGQAFALNLGVQSSTASVFTILNDDDYLMHDAIEAILALLAAHPDIYLLGSNCVTFSDPGFLSGLDEAQRLVRTQHADYRSIPITRFLPSEIERYQRPGDLSMVHSGETFFKTAWQAAGGYYPQKRSRVVIHSDRDFQFRVASLLPVGVTYQASFAFWRSDSSVDLGLYS